MVFRFSRHHPGPIGWYQSPVFGGFGIHFPNFRVVSQPEIAIDAPNNDFSSEFHPGADLPSSFGKRNSHVLYQNIDPALLFSRYFANKSIDKKDFRFIQFSIANKVTKPFSLVIATIHWPIWNYRCVLFGWVLPSVPTIGYPWLTHSKYYRRGY